MRCRTKQKTAFDGIGGLNMFAEQRPITFPTLLDLLRGALDARLRPTGYVSLARRRSAAISYICMFPLFLLFLCVLLARPVANPFSSGSGGGPGSAGYLMYFATPNSPIVQTSSQVIVWGALVDGVALLVSGLLLAGTLMRSALGARRVWVRLLAALPALVELFALVGLVTLLVLLFAPQTGHNYLVVCVGVYTRGLIIPFFTLPGLAARMGNEPLAAGSAHGLCTLALVPRAFFQNGFSDPSVTLSGLRLRGKFGMLSNDRGIVRVAMYHECTYRCKHGCYRRAPGGEDLT
ncbi:MAG TPA: hypothetical protein VKB35_15830 [Ktedonobacteraceae bacterium]|nr:hypothetical protein [Ktedonobacteraceae bacterium]